MTKFKPENMDELSFLTYPPLYFPSTLENLLSMTAKSNNSFSEDLFSIHFNCQLSFLIDIVRYKELIMKGRLDADL